MKIIRYWTALLCCLLVGCAHSPPAAFNPLAQQFKAKACSSRITEGRQVADVLPTCPIHIAHFGFVRWHNWERPSYKLAKDDLFQNLGKPAQLFELSLSEWQLTDGIPTYRIGPTAFAVYDLGRDNTNVEQELVITLYNDYVVTHLILKKTAVESAKHSYYGANLVTTNYPLQ